MDKQEQSRCELATQVYELAGKANVSITVMSREVLGVSPATFYLWRTGGHAPSLASAFLLAAVKGMLTGMLTQKELPVKSDNPMHSMKVGTDRLIAQFGTVTDEKHRKVSTS
jgi:hypothetical protein